MGQVTKKMKRFYWAAVVPPDRIPLLSDRSVVLFLYGVQYIRLDHPEYVEYCFQRKAESEQFNEVLNQVIEANAIQ